MTKAAKVAKMTREGKVWIGKTTSGVIKGFKGGLLFKIRFNNSHSCLVNRRKWVYEDLNKAQATKEWEKWSAKVKAELYDVEAVHKEVVPTFAELGVKDGPWYSVAKTDYFASPASFKHVASKVVKLATEKRFEWFASLAVDKITLNDCQALMEKLMRDYHKSYSVRARYKQAVSSVFNYAIERGFVLLNPNQTVRLETKTEKRKRNEKHHVIALTKKEFAATLDMLNQEKNITKRVLLLTAFKTGMRRGEIIGLTWDEVHLGENPYIELSHGWVDNKKDNANDQSGLITIGTKNGKGRIVPVTPDLKQALLELKKQTTHKQWVMGNGQEYDFVFCHPKTTSRQAVYEGCYYSANIADRWWNELNHKLIASGAVRQRINFHKIRATALTNYASNPNLSIDDVRRIAGHSDMQTTLKYYVKEDDNYMKKLGAKMIEIS